MNFKQILNLDKLKIKNISQNLSVVQMCPIIFYYYLKKIDNKKNNYDN